MVTFVCQECDRTLKKNQIERHTQCRPLAVICIDCSTTFYGQDYKAHTSCLTEQQKYFGEFAKKPKNNTTTNNNNTKSKQQIEEKKVIVQKQQIVSISMEVEEPVWKWKNEIKRIIIQHDNKIQYDELKKIVLKNYKKVTGQSISPEIEEIFDEKVKKLSNIKIVTYVEL